MAVAWHRNPDLDVNHPLVDRSSVNDRTFGVTKAQRHPAYVYSVHKSACLMHRVVEIEMHWYALVNGGHHMGRLKQPAMMAHTACGETRLLLPNRARTCHVPLPDSVLCGRCHGEPPTFGKRGKGTAAGLKRSDASVKLGCEVNGYPSSLDGVR